MISPRHLPLAFLVAIGACAHGSSGAVEQRSVPDTVWTPLAAPTEVSLRGICVPSADVVWASGADATVLLSRDGGRSFVRRSVGAARGADLRSIHAFSADVAVCATAGQPALVLRTEDAGASWQVVFEDPDPAAFFDAVRFADARSGYVFGDPTSASGHYLLASSDGGRTWQRVSGLPAPVEGEAGFAASGTCLSATGTSVRIGTGGAAARVLRSDDGGRTWNVHVTPLAVGAASRGVFSLAFASPLLGLAVGGDYLDPDERARTAAFTTDGGRSWQLPATTPGGYRSGVAFAPGFGPDIAFAVGPTGADATADGGRSWHVVGTGPGHAHHGLAFAPDAAVGFAVGAGGRVSRITPR